MALAKVLLSFAAKNENHISWIKLSKASLEEYMIRLENNPNPQQAAIGRLTKMEHIVKELELGKIDYEKC